MKSKKILILGTRGIPAEHGGFETFAQRLALYLEQRNWMVTVYCQSEGKGICSKKWNGIELVYIPSGKKNSFGSILFDFRSTLHAATENDGIILTLGYNTAIFSILYRLCGRFNIINMDGLEWQRQKWNAFQRSWLYINERIGARLGNYLIADHPEIKKYLARSIRDRKIFTIPYGANDTIHDDASLLAPYNLTENSYALVIARPEPENSILEIVSAFSDRPRGYKLVVLGNYHLQRSNYHCQVQEAASEEVLFLGAIYDSKIVQTLRVHTRLYIHGHTVGGTNPSLIEALAANSPVLAHDNAFNRWVAGKDAHYFSDRAECMQQLNELLDGAEELEQMSLGSKMRYQQAFADDKDLKAYEELFILHLQGSPKKSLSHQWESS